MILPAKDEKVPWKNDGKKNNRPREKVRFL